MAEKRLRRTSAQIQAWIGQNVGSLTIGPYVQRPGRHYREFECSCRCGRFTYVRIYNLEKDEIKSCGCLKPERMGEISRTHGHTKSPIFDVWRGMMRRCYNPDFEHYPSYGGRGITVCERWHDFAAFESDMLPTYQKGLWIERRENNGNYEPDNCIWATPAQQAKNRRPMKDRHDARLITAFGRTLNAGAWARHLGIDRSTLVSRISRGVSPEQALSSAR